ncbi:hypothetical protein HD557_000127 [Nocardioides luteus]|nr:hypothetical protein [Nocardioides luteus]
MNLEALIPTPRLGVPTRERRARSATRAVR